MSVHANPPRQRRRWLTAALIGAAGVITAVAIYEPAPAPAKAPSDPGSAFSILSAGKDEPRATPVELAPPKPRPALRLFSVPVVAKDAEFERKAASANVKEQAEAYRMAKACLYEQEAQERSVREPCVLSPGGKWIDPKFRKELVVNLARNGFPDSDTSPWADLYAEGPKGRAMHAFRPDEENEHTRLLEETKKHAIETRDSGYLAYQSGKDAQEGNLARSLELSTAALTAMYARNPQASDLDPAKIRGDLVDEIKVAAAAGLSKAEIDRAINDGLAFGAKAK